AYSPYRKELLFCFCNKIYKLRRMRRVVFRCGPLLSAGTAKAVLSSPAPASSSNALEYSSSAQGNKEVYSSSPLSAGSSDTCWDCDYSSHRKPLFPQESTVPCAYT